METLLHQGPVDSISLEYQPFQTVSFLSYLDSPSDAPPLSPTPVQVLEETNLQLPALLTSEGLQSFFSGQVTQWRQQ